MESMRDEENEWIINNYSEKIWSSKEAGEEGFRVKGRDLAWLRTVTGLGGEKTANGETFRHMGRVMYELTHIKRWW